MTNGQPTDRATAETAAGAVWVAASKMPPEGPRTDVGTGESDEGGFDAGEFVVDHDADPPEEVQPTTS